MIKSFLTLTAASVLALTPPSKVELKFKLESGYTYLQTSTISSNVKQTMMGQENLTETTNVNRTYFKLKEQKGDHGLYDLWYGETEIGFVGMGQEQKFSSTDTTTAVGSIMSKLVDRKFEVAIYENGSVGEIGGLEEIIAEIQDSQTPETAEMAGQVVSSFNQEGLASNLEMGLNIFPEGTIKQGATWSRIHNAGNGFPMVFKNTYTLKEIKDLTAVIEVDGVITVDPDAATTDMMGMEATFFFDGTRKGTIEVELATGWVVNANFTDDASGSISIEANAQIPDGMTIPMEINNKMQIEGKKMR